MIGTPRGVLVVLDFIARISRPVLAHADPQHVRWSPVAVMSAENAASQAMARYARGEDGAFADVYDGLADRLFRYLRRLSRSETTAEDLVQQTFLRMHHARARFHDGADVVPWAYAIARRVFLDHARRGKRLVLAGDVEDDPATPASPLPDAEAILSAVEISGILEEELAAMPPVLREAFLLVREEGMSMSQAAEALGVSVAAMKVRAHRAYERLRDALAAEGIDREKIR